MQRKLKAFLPIMMVSALVSIFYVFFQSKSDDQNALNTNFDRYVLLMERQMDQKWVRTSIQMGALYATERQLQDLSDDFFSKAIIHKGKEIIGGFGEIITEIVDNNHIKYGPFFSDGNVYYRIPIILEKNEEYSDDLAITFMLNKNLVKSYFPTVTSINLGSEGKIVIQTSFLETLKFYYRWILLIFGILVCFALLIFIFTRSYFTIKQENIRNDIINHDLRTNSFNTAAIAYWMKKYISNQSDYNRIVVLDEIKDVEISYEINERIFSAAKKSKPQSDIFDLASEIKKIIRFVGIEQDLSRFSYSPPIDCISVSCDLNAFTVVVLNLLKNAIREIASKSNAHCTLSFMEAPKYVEVVISNDGDLLDQKRILKKGNSSHGSKGLGLSIVREQERVMQTDILVRWVKDKGKVICSFPIRRIEA